VASERGHKEIVQMLLQDKNINVNQQDENGQTALMRASEKGHEEIVQMLETRAGTLSFLCQKRKKHALFSLFSPKT
jgi:hypothetical protein